MRHHGVHSSPSRGDQHRRQRDPSLDRYLRELDTVTMLPGERETAAAMRLRELKRNYWRRLLDVRPVAEAIRKTIATQAPEAAVKAALASGDDDALAEAMLDVDPGCALADRIAADVHSLASGEPASTLAVRRRAPTTTLERHSAGLTSCRCAWAAERRSFVAANLRLVVTMAGRYQASGRLSLADLIQEGNLGLMTAVDRFDPRRGFRFSTYGAWWIRHAIGRALSDTGRTVRLPTHVIELQIKTARARRELEREQGREPENHELAARLGVATEQIDRLDRVLGEPQLGTTASTLERESPLEQLADDALDVTQGLDQQRLRDQMRKVLAELDASELDIVTKRFGLDGNEALTLREVGALYQRSRERIRQLQEGALAKVRHALEERGFAADDAANLDIA